MRHKLSLGNRGSALPLVLFFSLCAFITVSTYALTNFRIQRLSNRRSWEVQSLLNARSGVWLGLASLGKSDAPADTSGVDTTFQTDLFNDSANGLPGPDLGLGQEKGMVIVPYTDTSFGACTVQVSTAGPYLALTSTGAYRTKSSSVQARLGARPFTSEDSVLFLETPGMPEGNGSIDGSTQFLSMGIQGAKKKSVPRFGIDSKRKQVFLKEAMAALSAISDTALQDIPTIVKNTEEFDNLDSTVMGNLVIESNFVSVTTKTPRVITVLGDLQFTGDPQISNVTFNVVGEVKVFDKTILRSVSLFSKGRIFLAGETVFSGYLICLADIEIYENATIENKATVVSFGRGKKKVEKGQSATPFSIHVRDQAVVDGVLLDAGSGRGIETFPGTTITGVIWAQGSVCHEGRMQGVIRAKILVGRDDLTAKDKNKLDGFLEPIENVAGYVLPYFVGVPSVIEWLES